MSHIDILTFLLTLIIILSFVSILKKVRKGDAFKGRLKDLGAHREKLLEEAGVHKAYKRPTARQSTWGNLAASLQNMGGKQKEELKQKFLKAGWNPDKSFYRYALLKFFLIVGGSGGTAVFVILFTQTSMMMLFLFVIAAALIGSYSIDMFLDRVISERKKRINKALPETLDLMVICTEAGLSLNVTIQRVAREIAQICPDLGYELGLLSIEMNVLPDARDAIDNFEQRVASPSFQAIITTLMQAEQYGTPIAQTMRVVAEDYRSDRLLEAEERAGRIPTLITVPMMLFIFPSLFIVILGPAIISVMSNFNQ